MINQDKRRHTFHRDDALQTARFEPSEKTLQLGSPSLGLVPKCQLHMCLEVDLSSLFFIMIVVSLEIRVCQVEVGVYSVHSGKTKVRITNAYIYLNRKSARN